MNRKLYIETIRKECAFLEHEGYSFTQLENNIYYIKKTDSEGFRISFSWLEYGDKFDTQGVSARKRFNIVEQEIQKVIGGGLENYYTIHKSPTVDKIPNELEIKMDGTNLRFVSNTVKDIELFSFFLKSFYRNDIITFFNDYKEFSDVAKSYEKLEREKISTLIINTGTDIFYRELVIKNKSKANDEGDFAEMVFNELEPLKDKSTFSRILENFKILQSNLHQTA